MANWFCFSTLAFRGCTLDPGRPVGRGLQIGQELSLVVIQVAGGQATGPPPALWGTAQCLFPTGPRRVERRFLTIGPP